MSRGKRVGPVRMILAKARWQGGYKSVGVVRLVLTSSSKEKERAAY
jgi:hypothetical protein